MQVLPSSLEDGLFTAHNSTTGPNLRSHSLQGNSFGDFLQQAVTSLQETEQDASSKVTGLLSGDGTDIHTALIATQKASLAFDLALAVRNKALGAYQQVMGMQF